MNLTTAPELIAAAEAEDSDEDMEAGAAKLDVRAIMQTAFLDISPEAPEIFDAGVNFGVPDDCYSLREEQAALNLGADSPITCVICAPCRVLRFSSSSEEPFFAASSSVVKSDVSFREASNSFATLLYLSSDAAFFSFHSDDSLVAASKSQVDKTHGDGASRNWMPGWAWAVFAAKAIMYLEIVIISSSVCQTAGQSHLMVLPGYPAPTSDEPAMRGDDLGCLS
ncbi:hypothetical protein F4860DRAFT_516100 [Xylaria cubensis]|nr:hypothetical protein F4860DRAFT_516100 [Xylaria cubensis]